MKLYESFGANYGKMKPGGSIYVRGFEANNFIYEIDIDKKLLV